MEASRHQPAGKRLAAIGTFDGVHCGHRAMLRQMIETGSKAGYEPMAVTFDRHPLELVAPERVPKMLMPLQERVARLREILPHVSVVTFDDDVRSLTAREFMLLLRDRYDVGAIFMGFNHHFGSDRLRDIDLYRREAEAIGMRIFVGDESVTADGRKVSSTAIRRALEAGSVDEASHMLGRDYRLAGRVEGGERIGRTIGFPTANLRPGELRQAIPAPGVYACSASLADGRRFPAVVNIGFRPTVSTTGFMTIEAHLLDFEGDLYNSELALDFLERIRGERKFADLAALKSQIEADVERCRELGKH